MANISILISSVESKLLVTIAAGLALTLYGLFVEIKHDYSKSYVALCDISPSVSCSAAFLSDYGKGFGLLPEPIAFRNPVYGVAFYATFILLLRFGQKPRSALALFGLAVLSNLGSIYLASILTFVLHVACVVCISLYVVNFLLLIFTWRRYKLIQQRHIRELHKRKQ